MNDTVGAPQPLTWDIFRDIWQLAISDRKRLAAQFGFLDKAGLMQDAVFYPAVLARMQADDPFCKALADAFQASLRDKERQRCFTQRAWRWLQHRIDGLQWQVETKTVAPDPATWPSLEQSVLNLCLAARRGGKPPAVCAATPLEWRRLVHRMQDVLGGLTDPEAEVARELAGLAEALVAACEDAAAEAERAADLGQRRGALAERLAGLGIVLDQGLNGLSRLETDAALALIDAQIVEADRLRRDVDLAVTVFAEASAAESRIRQDSAANRNDVRRAFDAAETAETAVSVVQGRYDAAVDALRTALQVGSCEAQDPVAASVEPAELPPLLAHSDGNADDAVLPVQVDDHTAEPAVPQSILDASLAVVEPQKPVPPAAPTVAFPGPQEGQKDDEPVGSDLLFDEPQKDEIGEVPVEAADTSAAIWTGRLSLEEVMTRYLDRKELALAWHLADLAEENGMALPVPAALLKPLVASEVLTGPYDATAQHLGEWLATAMAAVEVAETGGAAASLRARSLALAALLRPALMARDTNARDHLRNLSLADGLSVFAPIVALLRDLRRDLQPSLSDLTELAGGEKLRRLPEALTAINEWLPGARKAQGVHAPSSIILHKLLDPQGVIGRLFESALQGKIDTIEAESQWLTVMSSDRQEVENLVAAAEKEIGRQKRDAIRGMALEWIVRKLVEGAGLLLDWRAAYHGDQGGDGHRKATLGPVMNELRKELALARRDPPSEDGIDASVQRLLDRAVADFLALLDGRLPQADTRHSEVFDAPLLRLPGLCQPYASDDPAFALERKAQRQVLFGALQEPDALPTDERAALALHQQSYAILPAQTLLDRLARKGMMTPGEVEASQHDIENAKHFATGTARQQITALRHDLEPLQSIDLATSPEIQLWLDRFEVIDGALKDADKPALPSADGQRSPVLPPDFPHLFQLLKEACALRDDIRVRIMTGQRQRLEMLSAMLRGRGDGALAAEAIAVAERLDTRDPITVEDILIRLQNGQSFAVANDSTVDHFRAFYPDFVAALLPEMDARVIRDAIQHGGVVGPLDFSGLQEHETKRALELEEEWRGLERAFKGGKDIANPLRSFMERLGFTSVKIERETALSPQLRWMWMRTNQLSAQDWFLPPVFGSEARGSYPVFLAHRNVDDTQLVAEMAKISRDAPCILLVLGRFSKARRESFGLAMRKAKQTVLLIDETQVLFLTTGGNWMERLFACSAPFGYLQPYTTTAGNIPVEMFFGRETEIAKIESSTADGCLVYGGRQLGKSALLHHVRKRFHQPGSGRHAYYLKIDEFGGQVQPAGQIWSEIRRVLAGDAILAKTADAPEEIRLGVLDWLDRGGERRILLLVDEADMFLASEARGGFPNLNPLKDLMEETERRFKVVFAGLHNVRRLAKAPNSPLVHLSDPICIGPLNTSAESSQQARRLVVEPMKAAGFDYEKPELVHSLLTRVNFYPSLMQVYLKALLEGLSNQARPQGAGPRWVLREDQLFRGPSSEGINSQIRERFQWTLNLDPRYELIAKVLARHRILSADAEGGTMAAEDVRREAEEFWPRGQEKLGSVDFPAFLDEMVDLGVLIRLPGPRGLYGLRGAQVAQMLGQLDQLDDEIVKIADKEPRVDYDPNHYHRRVSPDLHIDRRSPLPDQAMAELFNMKRPGLRLVVAAPAVLGGDQAHILADLANGWSDGNGRLTGEVFRGQEADLRRLADRVAGRHVLVLQAQGAKPDWLSWLAGHAKVRDGRLVPVVVGTSDAVARIASAELREKAIVLRAKPWERTMLRAWLSDCGLILLDTPDARDALLAVTGGAPAILAQLRQGLDALVASGRRDDFPARIHELGRDVAFSPAQIGLTDRLVPLFCNVAELVEGKGAADETLFDLVEDENPDARREVLHLTELGLFHRPEPSVIELSPLGILLYRHCTAPRKPG